ncbi:unnamed protein product [Ostreobium quekettii]|uniref:Uncharacterized protein n=1 Tax=Ostreobium quekettii TaxID=121088 RepID=A0A8S1JCA7_9CHLO|nr:unnamed protein product [Ostreobium quekettii]
MLLRSLGSVDRNPWAALASMVQDRNGVQDNVLLPVLQRHRPSSWCTCFHACCGRVLTCAAQMGKFPCFVPMGWPWLLRRCGGNTFMGFSKHNGAALSFLRKGILVPPFCGGEMGGGIFAGSCVLSIAIGKQFCSGGVNCLGGVSGLRLRVPACPLVSCRWL